MGAVERAILRTSCNIREPSLVRSSSVSSCLVLCPLPFSSLPPPVRDELGKWDTCASSFQPFPAFEFRALVLTWFCTWKLHHTALTTVTTYRAHVDRRPIPRRTIKRRRPQADKLVTDFKRNVWQGHERCTLLGMGVVLAPQTVCERSGPRAHRQK